MNLARSTPSYSEFGEEDVRDIVVRSYTIIGSVSGVGLSSLQVEAREAIIPDRNIADYCVRIELNSGDDYPQQSFSSISYSEIDRLVSMLKKLEKASISTDRFSFSEVQYEINDFKIIIFNTDRGALMVALSIGGVSIHLSSPSKLSSVTDLIQAAKLHLDKNKVN